MVTYGNSKSIWISKTSSYFLELWTSRLKKKKKQKDKTKKFDSIEIDEEMGNDKQNASRPDNVQMEP